MQPPRARGLLVCVVVLAPLAAAPVQGADVPTSATLYAVDRRPDDWRDRPAMAWNASPSGSVGNRNQSPVLYDARWRLPLHPALNRTVELDPDGTVNVTIHLIDDIPDEVTVQTRLLHGNRTVAEGPPGAHLTRATAYTTYRWDVPLEASTLAPDDGNLVWEIDLHGLHWGIWMATGDDGSGLIADPQSRIVLPLVEATGNGSRAASNRTASGPADGVAAPGGGAAVPGPGPGVLAAMLAAAWVIGRR